MTARQARIQGDVTAILSAGKNLHYEQPTTSLGRVPRTTNNQQRTTNNFRVSYSLMTESPIPQATVSLKRIVISLALASLIFLIPVTATFTTAIRFTAAVGVLMAVLWFTEGLPMGLTALLPLVLFPLGGIQSAEKIAAPYANSAVFLFLGGFLVAAAVEKWGLHRRVAYVTVSIVGTEPRRLVLAVLLVTALISMWISNTATTLMMTPIAVAIVRGVSGGEK